MLNVSSELTLLTCCKQSWLQRLSSHRRVDSHDLQSSPNCMFSVRILEVTRLNRIAFLKTPEPFPIAIVPFPIAMGLWNIAQARPKQVSPRTRKNSFKSNKSNWIIVRDTAGHMISVLVLLWAKASGTWLYLCRSGLNYCHLKLVKRVLSASKPECSSRLIFLL